jgi:hypothetical protein
MTRSLPAARRTANPEQWMLPSWPWTLRAVAISCLFAAELTNTMLLEDHFSDWLGSGIVFVAIGAVEGAISVALILRPSRRVYTAAVAISLMIISVWLVGLPFGPNVGRSDALRGAYYEPTVLLAVAAAALLPLTARSELRADAARGRGRGGSLVAAAMIVFVVAALALIVYRPGHSAGGGFAPTDATIVHNH